MKNSVVLVVALVLTLSSCADGDEATAAKNLKSEITANSSVAGSASVTDEEAGCIADGTVEKIGVDQLKDYDILNDDLRINQGIENVKMTGSDAEALADVFVGCVDTETLFEEQFTAGAGAAADLSDRQRACITDAVTEDAIADILAASFQGEENDAYADLQTRMMDCAIARD